MTKCAIVSFRLGLADGVSIVADRWREILTSLGFDVVMVAGAGPVDRLVPELAIEATEPPTKGQLSSALGDIDLVVVENMCTIPLNLSVSLALADYLKGRPTVMHHHDPPWQRDRFAHINALPVDDQAWLHVTINEMTKTQMATRGIEANTIYNPFRTMDQVGHRASTRQLLGVADDVVLLAHPVRAIARKNIPVALRLAEVMKATYWLLGEAEEGYGARLDWLLSTATVPTLRQPITSTSDIYAAADAVVFPSLWEGFGNPPIEASIHRCPVIVGDYPVAKELQALGFQWFQPEEAEVVMKLIKRPDLQMLEQNRAIAIEHFSMARCQQLLSELLSRAGWL